MAGLAGGGDGPVEEEVDVGAQLVAQAFEREVVAGPDQGPARQVDELPGVRAFHRRIAQLSGGPEAVEGRRFVVVRPGAFVRCAVTGKPIPIDELSYWSVDRQEPYADAEAAHKAYARQGLGRAR